MEGILGMLESLASSASSVRDFLLNGSLVGESAFIAIIVNRQPVNKEQKKDCAESKDARHGNTSKAPFAVRLLNHALVLEGVPIALTVIDWLEGPEASDEGSRGSEAKHTRTNQDQVATKPKHTRTNPGDHASGPSP